MTIHDLFTPFEDELQLNPSPRDSSPPRIEWCAAFSDFFFRPKGAPPEILWCDLGYTVTPKRPLPHPRPATLAWRVSGTFKGRTFFRVVPFPDGDDWLLIRPKRALVKSPQQPTGAFWKWNNDFDTKTTRSTQLDWLSQPQSWFENYLAGLEGDLPLQMARDCAALSEDDRKWGSQSDSQTTQWENLARALFILATPASTPSSNWSTSRPSKCEGPLIPMCYGYSTSTYERFLLHKTEVLLHLLQENIRLPYWRSVDKRGNRDDKPFPCWQLTDLTQHERLEAVLLWRDFAQQIDKSAEVEAVLHDLQI